MNLLHTKQGYSWAKQLVNTCSPSLFFTKGAPRRGEEAAPEMMFTKLALVMMASSEALTIGALKVSPYPPHPTPIWHPDRAPHPPIEHPTPRVRSSTGQSGHPERRGSASTLSRQGAELTARESE